MICLCNFQQCGILTSVDSDEPVQPPFKLRNSKWCSVSSLTVIEYSSDKQRLLSNCAYAQAGLSLCWSHIPNCLKSHALAQLLFHIWASTRHNLSLGFLIKRDSNQSPQIQRLARILIFARRHFEYSTFQNHNKGASQTAQMSRLVCAFDGRMLQRTVASRRDYRVYVTLREKPFCFINSFCANCSAPLFCYLPPGM